MARRSLPDVRRRPGGRRRMAKLPQESADHPANFNCELNLPDRRRMRAQGALNRRMAVGYLQDSSQGSPHGDPAIEFANCDVAISTTSEIASYLILYLFVCTTTL